MLLGEAYGKVTLDASGVQSGTNQAVSSMQNLQQAAEKVGAAMTQAGQMLTLGVTLPIIAFLGTSVKAAADSESAIAQLNAVIKSTGGVAGVTAKQVEAYATSMQKVTMFDKEAIMSGQSMLLTFTRIGKDIFPQASTAMLNMAQRFGSIDEASVQLGKALNDPILGVTALRRVGVMLSDQQQQQIKDFMAVNNIAGAQKVILKELETEFGGLALAAGDTTAGKFKQLQFAIQEFQESLGKALIPLLLPLIKSLTDMANAFSEMPPGVQMVIIAFLGMLAALGPVLTVLGTLITTVNGLAVAWPTLVAVIPLLGTALAGVGATLASIGSIITVTVIPALVGFTVAALPIIVTVALVVGAIALLYWAFSSNFMGITTTVQQLGVVVPYLIRSMWEAIKKFFSDGWHNLVTITNNIVKSITGIFNINWGQIGSNIINGILNGIYNGIAALIVAARTAANSVMATFKSTLGISSPSKVFEYLGQMTGAGYSIGLGKSMQPAMMASLASQPAQHISKAANYNQVNNFGNGLTVSQAARMQKAGENAAVERMMKLMGA